MARLNLVLLAIAIACALGIVTSQHRARKLFVVLEKEHERAKQLEIEFGQLQLEASTLATHARVEKISVTQLNMRALTPNRIQVLAPLESAEPKENKAR